MHFRITIGKTTMSNSSKKPVAPAVVFVAPCNRLATSTPAIWADRLRIRFEKKVADAIETAKVRLVYFKKKLDKDPFNAFDWSGKDSLVAAGRQRAALEVQSMLESLDAKNDGYAGDDNLSILRRVNDWIVFEVLDKMRYSSNLEPKDNARLMGLAELQVELKFSLEYFNLEFPK